MVSASEDIGDFEDWPRYESRVEQKTCRIMDLWEEYGVHAAFFTLGWVAEHYPKLNKRNPSSQPRSGQPWL
jgi:peptidoglycan/xylan/chitin deacetylase (PgdA/CDA1 family)